MLADDAMSTVERGVVTISFHGIREKCALGQCRDDAFKLLLQPAMMRGGEISMSLAKRKSDLELRKMSRTPNYV